VRFCKRFCKKMHPKSLKVTQMDTHFLLWWQIIASLLVIHPKLVTNETCFNTGCYSAASDCITVRYCYKVIIEQSSIQSQINTSSWKTEPTNGMSAVWVLVWLIRDSRKFKFMLHWSFSRLDFCHSWVHVPPWEEGASGNRVRTLFQKQISRTFPGL